MPRLSSLAVLLLTCMAVSLLRPLADGRRPVQRVSMDAPVLLGGMAGPKARSRPHADIDGPLGLGVWSRAALEPLSSAVRAIAAIAPQAPRTADRSPLPARAPPHS